MSKPLQTIFRAAFIFAGILQIFNITQAQTVETTIKITDSNAFVEGNFKDAKNSKNVTNFSFLKSYANVENLGVRISDVNLFDKNGQKVNYKKLIDGEFAVLEATKIKTRERDANQHNRTVEEMLIDHGILYGQELTLNGLKAFVIANAADKSGLPDSFLDVLPRSETEA